MSKKSLGLQMVKRAFYISVVVILLFVGLLFREIGQQRSSRGSSSHGKKWVLLPTPNTRSHKNVNYRGYMLALSYWEQLTSASRNLLGLQCWAGTLKMAVVEPVIKKSFMKASLDHKQLSNMMFRNLYDIDHWNRLSQQKGYAILESWDTFIHEAPRNIIAVDAVFSNEKKGMFRACPNQPTVATYLNNMANFNFSIVREVCVSIDAGTTFSTKEFYDKIFGSQQPWNSTVIFSQWRGFNRNQVRDSQCNKISAHTKVRPSNQLLKDAKAYQEKYFSSSNYISVMVRMEKVKGNFHKEGIIPYCYQKTLQYWKKLVQDTGVRKTFVTSDTGKFGSYTFMRPKNKPTPSPEFSAFFKEIYKDKFSVQDWENSFVKASGTTEAGYIGMLQKVVAAQAKCILFVGGGSYQVSSLQLYYLTHSPEDRCHHIVPNCTNKKLHLATL